MSSNVLIWTQLATYLAALLLSFCINIPLILHLKDFSGHCLLFSNGTWREKDGLFIMDWGSQLYCDYNIIWSCLAVIISLTCVWQFILHLRKDTDRSFFGAFLDMILCVIMSIASLGGAVLITMGYQVWCNAIIRRFEACEDATQNDIMKDKDIYINNFYMQFGTAQFGAWTSWVCWVGLSVFSILKLCRHHHQENIRASMVRERSRLVNEVLGENRQRHED